MIKLAMMCTDEASQARLQDCLRGETDISVIGSMVIQNILHESERGLAFMNKMVKLSPDVAILDQDILRETAARSMPVVIEYMQKLSFTRTIIIGERFHEQDIVAMMKGNARGFFLIDHLDPEKIVKCVSVVARGEIWLSGDLVGRVCDELIRECGRTSIVKSPTSDQLNKMKAISRREKEILALVSESMTNEEIAQKLFLSAKTVKTHVRNIFEKTNIRNRTEAALLYTRYRQEAVN